MLLPSPSPLEHLELYIRLDVDELGFERSPALGRRTVLGKSCAGYYGRDGHPDLSPHLHPLHLETFIGSLLLMRSRRRTSQNHAA